MKKLWQKATTLSARFTTIATKTNQIPKNIKGKQKNKEHEPEIQSLSDDEKQKKKHQK